MKLTPKQKEVIRKMREGEILSQDPIGGFNSVGDMYLTDSEISEYSQYNLIECYMTYITAKFYRLTELGKTIEL